MKPLLLIGGGGHCRSCMDVIEASGAYAIAGVIDRDGDGVSDTLGYPLLGSDADIPRLLPLYPTVLVTVGQITSPEARIRLFDAARRVGADLATIVSPRAHVSRHAKLGSGTIVMHGALVNACAVVGENCIVNSQALIEHDAVVESHSHVSTGARVNGCVYVERGSFIGSGAVLREGVRIGAHCVVGAGAVVRRDLPAGTLFRGDA